MYGIFTYIWLIFMANVDKYTIHESYGYVKKTDDLSLADRIGRPNLVPKFNLVSNAKAGARVW